MNKATALEAADSRCDDLDLSSQSRSETVGPESGAGSGVYERNEVANGQVVQRQAGAVPVDAAEQQVRCFGVVESSAVQEWRCHGCDRNSGCQTLDKFPKDVDLMPSYVVWPSPDEAVKITQLDTVRINQDQLADAQIGEF